MIRMNESTSRRIKERIKRKRKSLEKAFWKERRGCRKAGEEGLRKQRMIHS